LRVDNIDARLTDSPRRCIRPQSSSFVSEGPARMRGFCPRDHQMQAWQGYATVAIGVFVALVAFGQWVVARSKLMLDLFEHRLEVYQSLRTVVGSIMKSAQADFDTLREFDKATDRVPFLFGKDFEDYVKELRKSVVDLTTACDMLKGDLTGEQRQRHLNIRVDRVKKIVAFYRDAPPLVEGYMRMGQKHWWSYLRFKRHTEQQHNIVRRRSDTGGARLRRALARP
jgi:hypothetical protein